MLAGTEMTSIFRERASSKPSAFSEHLMLEEEVHKSTKWLGFFTPSTENYVREII